MRKIIELKGITKRYDGEPVLDHIDLSIYDNEFITLLGPSGCGKTTTLRIIAGFEQPDEGTVTFLGEDLLSLPPYKRNVNTVFQRYALFPHLNVFENIAFPLRVKKVPGDEIEQQVKEMLDLVALSGFEKRSVTSLSGGQQQRVAIARALISKPKVLLLGDHLYLRNTRSGRSSQHVRYGCGEGGGRDPADRNPHRHLQRTAKRIRSGLHWRIQYSQRHYA